VPEAISDRLIESVCDRLARNERVRRALPVWGRLHIDRQLPFLCVYRRPVGREDPETDRFVVGEAAYLRAPGQRTLREGLSRLVRGVAATLAPEFGAFLVLEVWSEHEEEDPGALPPPPRFRIFTPRRQDLGRTVAALQEALARVRVRLETAVVETVSGPADHAPGFSTLIPRAEAAELGVFWLGISIRPIWRREATGEFFPVLRRALSRRFARALKQAFFEFTREKTTHRPAHFHALGKRAMVKAVLEVDRQLAEVSDSFDYLLQVTPVNPQAAFREFERAAFRGRPVFHYRPVPADPALLKRKLYAVRIERVEDPTLALLFREKRRELDLQINLLLERDSPRALYSSLQLFGPVEDELLATAQRILQEIPARSREDSAGGTLDAEAFAAEARAELAYYRRKQPDLPNEVRVRDDMVGLMVSRGNLLVGREARIPASRVEALLQHEVGTHVLTYYNGAQQPFQQLHCGLAGYEGLQEGLAVLAEYLVGGLSRPRLRLLAARVVAVRSLIEGARFDDTFHLLSGLHGFNRKTAFTVTMRVYRGGGLTKDAIYLRGLVQVCDYLRRGGDLDTLFVGKIAADHVPMILELQRRKILYTPALRPRYLKHPVAARSLERVRNGLAVLDLVKGSAK
jgi:uncharacterized protein (TIGR02421 family)